jgi:RimJ/RimL family protein N-acetyltransferase
MNVHFRALHGPTDWGYVQEHMPLKRTEDTGGIVAVDADTNETVAAVIFEHWTEASVNAHVIVTNPLVQRHGLIEEVTDYVFNVAGRKVIIGTVPANNEAALALDKHIGFEEIARIPDGAYDGVDMVILTLRPEQCPYYTENADGQPIHAATA